MEAKSASTVNGQWLAGRPKRPAGRVRSDVRAVKRKRAAGGLVLIVGLAAALVPLLASLRADDASTRTTGLRARTAKLLVLKSGRVVKGTLIRRPDGYAIRTPHGEVVYSSDQVLCEAGSLREAYRELRRVIPHPTAAQHTALARWCLLHELYEDARRELMAALGQNPDHQTAREMLRKLDSVLGPGEYRPLEPSAPAIEQAREQLEARALGGLPRSLAREYSETIQPLLLNKCAAGACHGPYENRPFRLIPVRPSRSHRVFVEQNLATVLRQLDRDQPDQSPLLVRCTDGHDGRPRALFAGPVGRQQLLRLREWVAEVAAAMARSDSQDGPTLLEWVASEEASSPEPIGSDRAARGTRDAGHAASLAAPAGRPAPATSASTNPAAGRPELEKAFSHPPVSTTPRTAAAPRRPAPDPFDPERFNHRRPVTAERE